MHSPTFFEDSFFFALSFSTSFNNFNLSLSKDFNLSKETLLLLFLKFSSTNSIFSLINLTSIIKKSLNIILYNLINYTIILKNVYNVYF